MWDTISKSIELGLAGGGWRLLKISVSSIFLWWQITNIKIFLPFYWLKPRNWRITWGTPGTTVDTRQAEFSKIRGNRSHSQGWYLASVLQGENSPASKWTCISWALGQSLLGPVTATHPLNLSQILPLTCLLDLALPSSSACLSILVFFQAMSNLKSWYLNSSLAAPVAGKQSTCSAEDPSLIPGSGRSAEEGIGYPLQYSWAPLGAQLVKHLPAMWKTWVWSLGWEDPLETGMAIHSSIMAWRSPWTISWGHKESDMTE